MIKSLVLFHGIEVDALYLVLEDIFKQAGRVSTKMLCEYCMFDSEEGEDGMGWTSMKAFTFTMSEKGVYEIKIEDPVPIEPVVWDDIERSMLDWMISSISQ